MLFGVLGQPPVTPQEPLVLSGFVPAVSAKKVMKNEEVPNGFLVTGNIIRNPFGNPFFLHFLGYRSCGATSLLNYYCAA